MPTYDFFCQKCDEPFNVVLGIKAYSGSARCEQCNTISHERIFSSNITFIGTKIEDREYNPGLGLVTKSARHRKDEAKARGLEEIGTERPEKIHEHGDRERAEKMKRRWDEV